MDFKKIIKYMINKIITPIIYKIYCRYFRSKDQIKLNPKLSQILIDEFHKFYYNSKARTWSATSWLGVPIQKCPLDMWIYQEIIFDIKPDIIVECGTYKGGSALFLASICDLINKGRVVTVDISSQYRTSHPRIKYLLGSSTSPEIVEKIRGEIGKEDKVMVILDSDHTKNHVLNELNIYSEFVGKGSYLIVEDTNINGNPVFPKFGDGPKEAVQEFLSNNRNFIIDKDKEKFYLTFNPGGYLKRTT